MAWTHQLKPLCHRFCRDLGLAFLGCFFILVFLFQPYKVEGSSMLPALLDQERILVHKWIAAPETIQRGDIIVFQPPSMPGKSFIKRVIAVPGDAIELTAGQVLVNGRPDTEPSLDASAADASFGPHHVGAGHFFVLGDHRRVSSDSRHWGLVPHASIRGKAMLRYWPPESFGFVN